MINFAGIDLCLDTLELDEWLGSTFRTWDGFWMQQNSPTSQAWSWHQSRNIPIPRPGTLVWPNGANRWAVGYFVASKSQVDQIYEKLDAKEEDNDVDTLKVGHGDDDGNNKIVARMYMLAPVPLAYFDGKKTASLYLLVFVDERYWWKYGDVTGSVGVYDPNTDADQEDIYKTWDELIEACAEAIDKEVEDDFLYDSTEDVYLSVDLETVGINTSQQEIARTAADLLDLIAYNTGREICVDYDAKVRLIDVGSTDKWDLNEAMMEGSLTRRAGLDAEDAFEGSVPRMLPGELRVYFEKTDSITGEDLHEQYHHDGTTGGASVVSGAKVVCQDTTKALYEDPDDTEADPTNKGLLDDLADRLAEDWYNRFSWSFDIIFNGICNFSPCPQIDEITFVYSGAEQECSTRIRSRPWNETVRRFNHQDPDAPLPRDEPRLAKLTNDIWHRIFAPDYNNAILCKQDETPIYPEKPIKVICHYQSGYLFTDQIIEIKRINRKWQSRSAGEEYMGGTNGAYPISQGGSGEVEFDNGKTRTVYARWGPIPAHAQFAAWFNDANKRWEAGAEC